MNFKLSAFTFLLLLVNENGALGRQIRVSGNLNVDRRMQCKLEIKLRTHFASLSILHRKGKYIASKCCHIKVEKFQMLLSTAIDWR